MPRGRRLHCPLADACLCQFQSTPPSREATFPIMSACAWVRHFNPRLPRGRRPNTRVNRTARNISIHASLAGGDEYNPIHNYDRHISIHASLAGGDKPGNFSRLQHCTISIHASLAGGDFNGHCATSLFVKISIHASLAGGDALEFCHRWSRNRFQSTPPSREATSS